MKRPFTILLAGNAPEKAGPDGIYLHLVDMARSPGTDPGIFIMKPGETALERMRKTALKKQLAQTTVMSLLSEYTRRILTPEMFSRTEYGKPFLKIDPHEMCFNVSHSGSLLALAVSLNMDVGIDLEHDPGEDDLSGISACISADFYERLLQVPAKMQKHLFYNYWTANEAILKCIGNGLDRFIPPGDLDSPSGRFNVDGSKGYYQHENIPGIFSLCIAWQRPEYLP